MQRILQPGEIEALDRTRPPRVRLPQPASLFQERAARLRQLAADHPIGDYLRFLAVVADAQQQLARNTQTPPLGAATFEQAQRHAMPVLTAVEHLEQLDAQWQATLAALLDLLEASGELPPALQAACAALRQGTADARSALVRRVLELMPQPEDLAVAPLVMAAVQVVLADRASRIDPQDVPYTDPPTVCPICATAPVASVQRIGGQESGLRYLHCGSCGSEWHMVRVKCSHCQSTAGINYQSLQAQDSAQADAVVLAETCDQCHTYRKLVNQEKDPLVEPLADDLASLTLDLLMSETAYIRASGNPLLALGDEA